MAVASPSSSKPDAGGPLAGRPDPFAQLGLAPRYDIEPAELERAFFERSKELHPDRFANAPAAERVVALSKSRALNDAYQILKKPVPRAEYLLARAGVTIGDNERLDPTFLMEILELRGIDVEPRRQAEQLERVPARRGQPAARTARTGRTRHSHTSPWRSGC